MTLALDIETGNYSHEIGGWDQTHLFEPTVVATWDGDQGTIYVNKRSRHKDRCIPEGVIIKKLHPQVLGEDLRKHVDGGGSIIGHNIRHFDMPILRDALDCWTAGDLLSKKEYLVDTSQVLKRVAGHAIPLGDACIHTLGQGKTMKSHDAPMEWRYKNYDKVSEYCLKDAQLVYDLWRFGKDEGFVKARCRKTGEVKEYEIEW